jgi:pyruvate/2-oxoglutarate dehydrogenase complex dihydrolipoamide acyltransferase (E2) component
MSAAVLELTRERIFASPLARRLAKDAGLDLAGVTGSGPHGRIVERDVAAALANGVAAPSAPAQSFAPSGPSDAVTRKYFEPGSYEEIPLDSMRRAIAQRLTEAVRTIPHFYLEADCEIDALLRHYSAFLPGGRLRDRRAAASARGVQSRRARRRRRSGVEIIGQ